MVGRLSAVLVALLVAVATAGHASAFTRTDGTLTMDDGTRIATSLYLPGGTPPAAGWPAVLMLHGLGGKRQDMNTLAQTYFVPQGYAVLTYDLRGHGQSGGVVTIAGSREVADVRALEAALAGRPDVDDAHVGAWGISYGAGEEWLAAVQGVPFAAIELCETWTDLYATLFPGGLSKSGAVGGLINAIPGGRLAPQFSWLPDAAIRGTDLDRLRVFTAERSPLPLIGNLTVPALMLQGRRDFVFGIEQAINAFQRLKGPKLLYLGDHGHTPSTFPAADTDYAMTLSRTWFDRFLKGQPNGVDTGATVQLAPDPWKGKAVGYPGLPPTKTLTFPVPGPARTIGASDHLFRVVTRIATALEDFGAPVLTVTASASRGWSRLVALLTAVTPTGQKIVVSAGGVPTTPGRRKYTFRLISQVTAIPAGSRLALTLGSSTSGTAGGSLYLAFPAAGTPMLTVGPASLRMPVLVTPVSR
ncbi:MAG TPA: CocE/NonD family hydrolase [Gaiellaceae bacterium]|nr:CocE/NonD family hydrolase [Gaiellaceae bacterium]